MAQPCDLDVWHVTNLNATYDPLGEGWVNTRFLPTQVRRRWSGPRTARKSITVEVEPETFGYPGIELPTNPGAGGIWVTKPAPAYFAPYQDKIPDLGLDIAAMVAWNSARRAGLSLNWGTPHTAYSFLAGGTAPGEVVDATLNPNSAFFADPLDPLEKVLLTYDEDADALSLYSIPNLINDPLTQVLVETFAGVSGSGDSFPYTARIVIDEDTADFWVMGWKNRDGTYVQRSDDGGSTWSGGAVGYTTEPDDEFLTNGLGLAVQGGHTVVVARDGTQDVDDHYLYFVYHAATTGGAFSQVANPTDFTVAPGALALTAATSAIVPLFKRAAPEPTDPLEAVTFDAGGYTHYTISGFNSSGEASDGAYGSQADMAYGATVKGTGTSVAVNVIVDLDAFYTFNSLTFWTAFLAGWTLDNRSSVIYVTVSDAEGVTIKQKVIEIDDAFPINDSTYTVTAADLGLSGSEQAWFVTVTVQLNWTDGAGTGTSYVFVDDIDIDADLIEFERDSALHTLALGGPTYTKRQSYQLLPFHHYGIAAYGNSVTCIACDEDGNNPSLLLSTNGGTNWTKSRTIGGYVGAKRSLFAAILFGYDRLAFSPDGGITLYAMIGDWPARLGTMGRFEGVAGVLGAI